MPRAQPTLLSLRSPRDRLSAVGGGSDDVAELTTYVPDCNGGKLEGLVDGCDAGQRSDSA